MIIIHNVIWLYNQYTSSLSEILSSLLFIIYDSDQHVLQDTFVDDYTGDKIIISIRENSLISSGNLQIYLNLISSWFTK